MTDEADANTNSGNGAWTEVARTVIVNKRGLHARAAARFVVCTEGFDAEVEVARQDVVASGRSIMGLLLLAAGPGAEIEIRTRGAEAQQALQAVLGLVQAKFEEE